MPRSKKTEQATQKLGIINNHAGETVSINLKKRTYFGLGDPADKKVWLSPENWSTVLPNNLTVNEADMISNAIASGDLVSGKKWIPAIDKDVSVLNFYLGLLNQYRTVNQEFKDHITNLFRHKKKGNYTAIEIFRKMRDKEVEQNNRKGFVSYLEAAIENYSGPVQLVQDFPNDPDNYKVSIDPGTMQVTATDKPAEERLDNMQFKGLDDPSVRAAAVENALE
jgi:hypothetical protein